MAAVNTITTTDHIHINMNDTALLRSLAIGWYVEGWAHAFAICSNCDSYHTVSQGETCHNGNTIMHRTNAMTNYLYIPDPVIPVLSPPASPSLPADAEPQNDPPEIVVGEPMYVLYENDDDETVEDDGTEEED